MIGKMLGRPLIDGVSAFDIDEDRRSYVATEYPEVTVVNEEKTILEDPAIEAVVVATPVRTHFDIARQALQHGKHVLCEKPLTATYKEALAVGKAYRKASLRGVIGMINFSKRDAPPVERAIELVRGGMIGEVRHLHASYMQSWLSSDVWANWTDEALLWRLSKADGSGGVLADLGCHILDMATAVAGEPARLRCNLRTFSKIKDGLPVESWSGKRLDANDTALIEFEMDGGGVGLVQTTRWATGTVDRPRLEVYGTDGAVVVDLREDPERIRYCFGDARHSPAWTSEQLRPTPNLRERFVAAIRGEQLPDPDLSRGVRVQEYLDACERSSKDGSWVSVS